MIYKGGMPPSGPFLRDFNPPVLLVSRVGYPNAGSESITSMRTIMTLFNSSLFS